jgi:hypothetical protein
MSSPTPPVPNLLGLLEDFRSREEASAEHSVVERVLDHLQAHEREEQSVLTEYERAAAESADAGVRYLMTLIVNDERQHHRLSEAMASDMRQSLEWLGGESPIPMMNVPSSDRQALLAMTNRFLEIERDGQKGLEDLRHQVKGLHANVFELILQLMESDTTKHILILNYIKKHLEK